MRWVRARARLKGFKIDWFTARARTHLDLILKDQGIRSKDPVQNFLDLRVPPVIPVEFLGMRAQMQTLRLH